jgi:NAD(P)-dependent dehydrogenase (short-subunit alcohol dehydrogenase family)
MRLKGKTAIITGSGGGQGRTAAVLFAKEGARVVVTDWDKEIGRETTGLIEKNGGEAVFVHADVSKDSDVKNLVETATKNFGRLDILYNNAGSVKFNQLADLTEEEWDYTVDIEMKGVWLCTKYAIPKLIEAGGGSIINTASVAGLLGLPTQGAHCAAKAGVIALTRVTAIEYAKQGIRANAICPGLIRTPATFHLLDDPTFLEFVQQNHPIGRLGEPEDIAPLALYLASDESCFMTGSIITIDGGWTAH